MQPTELAADAVCIMLIIVLAVPNYEITCKENIILNIDNIREKLPNKQHN